MFLLVLFPLTLLSVSLGVLAQQQRTQRDAAADVTAQVEGLRNQVDLQRTLFDERASVELSVRSATFGVPSSFGAALLGLPTIESTRADTDAVLARPLELPDGFLADLQAARESADRDDPDVVTTYNDLESELAATIIAETRIMQDTAAATGDLGLLRALVKLEASVRVFVKSSLQTTALADAWFGPPENRNNALIELNEATTTYQIALEEIDPAWMPSAAGREIRALEDAISVTAEQLMAGELSYPNASNFTREVDVNAPNVATIISVFENSLVRGSEFVSLVEASADGAETTATEIANDASDDYGFALLVGGLAIGLSVLLSWRLAVSIANPLAVVARRAEELRSGQIVADPLPLDGPREIRHVARAVNEVSTNLDAMEGKLDALSRADLDDPALVLPLPGRLGHTLSKSVNTLSRSIADRRDLQNQLRHQANHDALTGLANRQAVLDRIAVDLERADRSPVGILFVDLDDFKRANDVFGHRLGDDVLIEVGRRISSVVRDSDLVARLGGDEFLVVVGEDVSDEGMQLLAERIVATLEAPMAVEETGGLVVGASVGVATTSDPTLPALSFLARADAALYRAKSSDDRIVAFDLDLELEIGQRTTVEQRLRLALANQEFDVHFQPVLTAGSHEVNQLEALIRWIGDDTYGPDVFIPVAEASDLVIALDCFMLERATALIAGMVDDGVGAPDMRVAINLSGRHLLHSDVVHHVEQALAKSGLSPERLIIEVTETALVVDLDRAAAHLAELRRLGVRVAVDDFGTGFTSISQLQRLPVDELKIDRSLVQEAPTDQALIRVVRDLAEHFGLSTVAEGVETTAQEAFLEELGCTSLQGWLYAKAMPADQVRTWLDARSMQTT